MASYYPEGECFFRRSSLKYAGEWSAEDKAQFYSHVLVEYQWNGWFASGDDMQSWTHPRAKLVKGGAALLTYNTLFGVWDRFSVGESVERTPDKSHAAAALPNSDNFNECRDRDQGGPRKYILRPVQITNTKTKWLWIDGTIPLRAIYFPVAHKSDEAFQDYCTYVVIDFRARKSVKINDLSGRPWNYDLTPYAGLDYQPTITWGFNIPGIIVYLSLPRQLRNPEQGLFQTAKPGDELVIRAAASRSWRSIPEKVGSFHREMDLSTILSANFGIDVGWRPYKYSSFVLDLVKSVAELGLAMVPTVGPLLAVAFSISLQIMADPDSFSTANVLSLNQATMDIAINHALEGKKFVVPDILKIVRKRAPTGAAGKISVPTSRGRKSVPASLVADSLSLVSDSGHLVSDLVPDSLEFNLGDEDEEEETTGAPPTEAERKAAREADEASNARLTELKREIYGEEPPQSQAWLDRQDRTT